MVKDEKVKDVEKKSTSKAPSTLSFTNQKIMEDLSNILQTKVQIQKNKAGKGKLIIPFTTEDDLERIAELLGFL